MTALDRPYWIEARIERREGWDAGVYPFSLPVVRDLDRLVFHPRVTFLVGENGSGKSTLIEALAMAWGFNAEGGSTNVNFSTRASHSPLSQHIRRIRGALRPIDGYFLRAESFFNVATNIEEVLLSDEQARWYGERKLHEQSHGESFLALFEHRFGDNGLYLFDEPEAALSPQRQLAVLSRLHDMAGRGSQFVIATHAPILLAFPGALIYQLDASGIAPIAYEDTPHFQITRDFLNHRERFFKHLLRSE